MSEIINTVKMARQGIAIRSLIGRRCEVKVGDGRVLTGTVEFIRDNMYPSVRLDSGMVYHAGTTLKLI